MPEPTLLPCLNPSLPYLADGLRFLNRSVAARDQPEESADGWLAALSRASAIHSIGALHAALSAAIHFEEGLCEDRGSLAEKAHAFIEAKLGRRVSLPEEEASLCRELDQVFAALTCPQARQAEAFPSARRSNLIQFPRTAIKKISLEATTWVPPYAACVLAMALGILRRSLRHYLKISPAQLEVYLGDHAHNAEGYSNRLNPRATRIIAEEARRLVENLDFMEELRGPRWRLEPEQFSVEFLTGI